MKNINILIMSALAILFSANLHGCSNERSDIGSEQDLTVDNEHQYVLGKDAESGTPESTIDQLKQVMLLSEQSEGDILIYGKTGMGMSYSTVIDAWYTGFAGIADKKIYFCVYLGETDNKDVSGAKAKEIAVKIVSGYLSKL